MGVGVVKKAVLLILFLLQVFTLQCAAHSDTEDAHVSLRLKLLAAVSKKKRKSALFDSIRLHEEDTFQYLMEKYPELRNSYDDEGFTPLLRLLEVDHQPEHFWKKALTILFSYEVDINAVDRFERWTPLLRAVNCKDVPLDLIKLLVKKGASVHENREEDTPLMIAARNGRQDIVEFLIQSGARVDAQNRWERTAADEARLKGYIDVADYIDGLISEAKFVNLYRYAD